MANVLCACCLCWNKIGHVTPPPRSGCPHACTCRIGMRSTSQSLLARRCSRPWNGLCPAMVRRARHCQHIQDVSLQANAVHATAPLCAAFHTCTILSSSKCIDINLLRLSYGLPAQEFCELFAEPELFISFHRACHGNERVSCSGWTVSGDGAWHRDAAFLMPYQAPAWLKKAVGARMCSACLRACIQAAGAKLRAQCHFSTAGTSIACFRACIQAAGAKLRAQCHFSTAGTSVACFRACIQAAGAKLRAQCQFSTAGTSVACFRAFIQAAGAKLRAQCQFSAAGTSAVYVKDHHTVHFGGEGGGGPAGRGHAPAHADAAACSRPQAQPGAAPDAARAAVLARLASGQAASFVMRTAPALATPWGRTVPIAEMLFSFAADAPPPATGFTVRCPPRAPTYRALPPLHRLPPL